MTYNIDTFTFCLFLILSTQMSLCRLSPARLNIDSDSMTVISCSDPNASPVLETSVHQTRTVRSFLACAVSCISDKSCAHAIFRESNKTCQRVEFIDNSLKHYNSPRNEDEGCMVLTVTKRLGNNDQQHPLDQWREVDFKMLRNWTHSSFLPLKAFRDDPEPQHVCPAAYVRLGGLDYIMLTHDKFELFNSKNTFYEPLRTGFHLLIGSDNHLLDRKWTGVSTYGKRKYFRSATFTGTFFVRDDFKDLGKDTAFVNLTSIESLTSALLRGHRPVQQGPYSTRAMIDAKNNDVHFDTTEMFVVSSLDEMKPPLYYTSIKESAKSGKRYTLRHLAFVSTSSSNPVESNADSFWVFDTRWTKLEPRNPHETVMEVLKGNILEGKEVRLVIGGEISTDVNSARVTPNDVIVSLTKYIAPFKSADRIRNAPLKVRFPVFGTNGQKIIECETEYLENEEATILNSENVNGVDWFVSSRYWTKIFEMNSNLTVLYGNVTDLYRAAKQGYNIRVCVINENSTQTTICLGATDINLRTEGVIILQSPALMNYEMDGNLTLNTIPKDCLQIHTIVSTEGVVTNANFHTGRDFELIETVDFDRQTWFVEDKGT